MQQDGSAVAVAENRKTTRYGQGKGGISCALAGFESWGRLGVSASSVLARLAGQNAAFSGRPRARVLQQWKAELGMALCRSLAESVRQSTRRPADVHFDDGGGEEE